MWLFCCFRGSLTSPNATSNPLPQRFRHVRRPKLLVDRRASTPGPPTALATSQTTPGGTPVRLTPRPV